MGNIINAEDAYLSAKATIDKFIEDFERKWYEPVTDQLLMMAWQEAPLNLREEMRRADPDKVKSIEEMIAQNQKKRGSYGIR